MVASSHSTVPIATGLLTVAEAARSLGIRPVSVRRAIYAKRLTNVKMVWAGAQRNFVTADSVEHYRATYLGRHGPRPRAE